MTSSNQVSVGDGGSVSDSRSLLNSPSLDVSDQSAFVELLLMDFSAVLNKGTVPLHDNEEYMQLTELKQIMYSAKILIGFQLHSRALKSIYPFLIYSKELIPQQLSHLH